VWAISLRSKIVAGNPLIRTRETQLEELALARQRTLRAQSRNQRATKAPPRFVAAPFVCIVTAVAAGIALDRFVDPWGTRKWLGLALVFVSFACFLPRRRLLGTALVLAALVPLGGAWHHYRYSEMEPDDLAQGVTEVGRPAWVRGVVREALGVRKSGGFGFGVDDSLRVSTRFVLDLTEFSDGKTWRKGSGRATTIVTGDRSEILPGQPVEAAGQLALLAPPLNPGEFDYRAFARVEGIRLRLTVGDPQSFWRRTSGRSSSFAGVLGRIRSWSRARLFERIEPSVAPLASALILGQREGIEPDVNDAFARTGTTHLLAISGLQLQALAGALLLIFRLAGLTRRPTYSFVFLSMVAYAVVIGPAPSVVRATVMTATFCLASIAGRLERPGNTLSLAALGTLAINPSYLFDVGCQLSFLAIGALIWLVPAGGELLRAGLEWLRGRFFGPFTPLDELERSYASVWRRAARSAGVLLINGLITSAVVFLAALPLVALRFHLVSPIGVILNIPLIPITTLALLLGGLGLAISTIWGPLGAPFAWAAAALLKLTKAIVLWGVSQAWGHRFVVGPAWGWVLVFYVVLVFAVFARVQTRRLTRFKYQGLLLVLPWWMLLAWVVPGWLLSSSLASRVATTEAEFLSVGHGLAVLIQTPDGRALLYDCGRLGDPSVGRRIVAPALWARGLGRIDAVFLSHADQDHYNGVLDLLDRFPIGVVHITPGFGGPANPSAVDLLARIRSRGVPVREVTALDSWKTGGVTFTIRHPPAGWAPEASDNTRSIVLDVACAGRHMLLTGDLELSGLEALVAQPRPEPPPEVILAPHHGGRAANPEWLYEWAKPRLVVASQRAPSSTTSDALATVERLDIPVLRTWRRGAVRIRWSDAGLAARAFLDEDGTEMRKIGSSKDQGTTAVAGADSSHERNQPRAAALAPALEVLVGLAGFVVGAFACLFLAVIEIGAWALVMPYRSVATSAVFPPGGSALADDVDSIMARASDGSRLVARWFPAPGPGATGRTVLLLHGFAETSRALEASRAAALNHRGWNVAALDSRGHGLSEGHYSTFGGLEAGDIQVWLDELAGRLARTGPAAPFQPVLWGRSMGAAIALRAAALDPRVVALVLEAPMVDIVASTMAVMRRRRLPFPRILAHLVVRRAGKLAGMPIDRPGPLQTAPTVHCSTAIIHGTDDPIVPIRDARRLAGTFPSPPRWFEIPGAKHTDVVDKGGAELLDQIVMSLDERLREGGGSR
jgi:competence protein ComEC